MKDLPKNTETLLRKWNGGNAIIWSYSVSLQQLVLRVEKPKDLHGNLHITCSPCLSIIAPVVRWKDARLSLSKTKDDDLVGATFQLKDESMNVIINCMGVCLDEDVEPIFFSEEKPTE